MSDYQQYDAVTIAMEMGMDRVNAQMAVPQMWLMAATTDVYNPVTIMIVETLQHRLGQLGYQTRGDGFIDKATGAAMTKISGPNWKSKTWLQLYGDVLYRGNGPVSPTGASGMGYSSMGSLPDSQWCSTSNPQGNCKPIRGIVLPMTMDAALTFKQIQSQVNRIAHMKGFAKVAVDGRIGPGTLAGVNKSVKLGTAIIGFALPGYPNVDALAANADVVEPALIRIASSLSAPTRVAGPAPKAPPSGTGGQVNPPREMIVNSLPLLQRVQQSNLALAGLGLVVVSGLWYWDSKKGKKKKLKPPKILKGIF